MATLAEHAADLAALKATLTKARDEIIARVDALEALLAAAGTTTPEIDAEMSALRAIGAALDDLNPDAPPPEEPQP